MIDEVFAVHLVCSGVDQLYFDLHHGMDVSPGARLRFEGKVELLLECGVIDRAWLEGLVNDRYQHYFGQSVDPIYWEWMKTDNRFYLPWQMLEAPVYLQK